MQRSLVIWRARAGKFLRWGSLIGGALGVALLSGMIAFIIEHFPELHTSRVDLQPSYVVLSLVLVIASYGAFSRAWRELAEHAGFHASDGQHALRWSISLLGKYIPGKIWQGAGRIALYTQPNRWRSGGVAVVIEAASQLWVAAALGSALLLSSMPRLAVAVMAVCGIAAGVVYACSVPTVCAALSTLLSITGLQTSWKLLSTKQLRNVMGWQAIGYCFMALGYVCVARACDFDGLGLAQTLAAGLLLSGAFGLTMFIVPTGLGARDAALAWILMSVLSQPNAVMLALVARLWLLCAELITIMLATLLFLYARIRRGEAMRRRHIAAALSFVSTKQRKRT